MAENRFWGATAATVSVLVAAPAGLVKGAYDAASGNGTFRAGFEQTMQSVIESAEKFGRENGDAITAKLRGAAAGEIRKRVDDAVRKSINRRVAR